MSEKFLIETERNTPIIYDVDVAVVGGGTAGAVAAIAAARTGVSTVLIEKSGSLGGCPTVGRCTHLGNTFIGRNLRRAVAGIPLEIMDRLVKAGGTTNSNLEELLTGRVTYSTFIIVDPEVLAVILIEMVEEAGVKLMLHTLFCDAIMEENFVKGILVQSKAGRQAVLAKNIIDASGEADVALSAGASCTRGIGWWSSYGLLMRMGNVDIEEFLAYFLSLEAGKPNPEYTGWLSSYLGLSVEEIKKDGIWGPFIDPQPVGIGVPATHPGSKSFSSETQEFFNEKWKVAGYFAYINTHFFRDLLRKAADNGDFELSRKVDDIGEITLNLDGFTSGLWRKGEVVINAITFQCYPTARKEFDAFDIEHITKIEVAARKRVIELTNFLKKYMPGWENCYIVDTGAITMPRHVCMIEGEYTLTLDDVQEGKKFDDAIFLAPFDDAIFLAPYRMMLPKKIENLLVAGKCASGSPYVRAIPSIWAMGQAAGTAAALACRKGVTPRQVDISDLQETLREQGTILDFG